MKTITLLLLTLSLIPSHTFAQMYPPPSQGNPMPQQGSMGNQRQGPMQQQEANGPYQHQIFSASSQDGLTWQADNQLILDHASVPSAITKKDGSILMYYVDGTKKPDTITCALSNDNGKTFTAQDFRIDNLPAKITPVDPSPFLLPDGRIRLYFFASTFGFPPEQTAQEQKQINSPQIGGPQMGNPQMGGAQMEGPQQNGAPRNDELHAISSAISSDGVHFTYEQKVFEYAGLVDPDVFYTGKEWLMYVMGRGTIIAKSSDGLNFSYVGMMQPERYGTTKPVTLSNGQFRMYAFKQPDQNQFFSFISTDGIQWTLESGVRLTAPSGKEITDPYVIQLKDGSWKMFYKISKVPNRPQQMRNFGQN